MTSIDDLFRKPNAPPKRKLEDPNTTSLHRPQPSNKAAKLSNGSSARGSIQSNGSSRTAFVTDEEDQEAGPSQPPDEDDEDIEAGPAMPPSDDLDDEQEEDDDEGRFFGGGVTKQEQQVLDYIDENDNDEEDGTSAQEKIDLAWLKRTAINFERKINRNAELRAKFEHEPLKFVASEADLDAEIKTLSLLTESGGELYADFVRSGCVGSLVGLLAHENTDIAIAVCELLTELTDEDAGVEEEPWKVLVDAMVESDVVDLLTSNLGRLEEGLGGNEADRAGVYHILNVVENLLSEARCQELFGRNERFMGWVKTRIKTPDSEARAKVGQNRQYAAEVLAIMLQGNEGNRESWARLDGVDVLLQLLSSYRKRDPEKDSDEEEFVENLFDCLVAVVKDATGAQRFLENEGVELCLIMLREGKLAKTRALRVLDHALGANLGGAIGVQLVDAAGLKTVFGMFMKSKTQDRETIEHITGIFASLLRYLPADSPARIRTLAKFVEKDYEKVKKLVDVRSAYAGRVKAVDDEISEERRQTSEEEIAETEAEWLSRRFDAGLFTLQTLDVILSWLVAEDDGARLALQQLLEQSSSGGLEVLQKSLREQLVELDIKTGEETRAMLEALLQCLE